MLLMLSGPRAGTKATGPQSPFKFSQNLFFRPEQIKEYLFRKFSKINLCFILDQNLPKVEFTLENWGFVLHPGPQSYNRGSKCTLTNINDHFDIRTMEIGFRVETEHVSKGRGCFFSNPFF